MARTRRERFFGAINEGYDALLSVMETSNERGYRASRTALREARKGEREVVGLARRWAEEPGQVYQLLEGAVDLQGRGLHRALELSRDAWEGAGRMRSQVQEAAQRTIKANREMGELTVEALRSATGDAINRVRGVEAEAEERVRPARAERRPARPRKPAASRSRSTRGRSRVAASNRRRPAGGNRRRAEEVPAGA